MGSSNAPSKMAKRIKNFLGVFPPPRPAGEAPQAREIPPYGDHPKLRPRKNGPQHLTPKVPSEEGESQDPDYQVDEEEEEHEDEDGDGNPATKRRRSPSVPSRSKHLRSKPTTRTISTNKHATSFVSHHVLHSRRGRPVPHSDRAPAALMNAPVDNTFRFLGVYSCTCLALNNQQSQKQCEVLHLYGFYYHPTLNSIICPKDRRAVLLQHWFSHLKVSHKTDHPGPMKAQDILAMKAHVAESFGLQESPTLPVLPPNLAEPLFMHDYFNGARPSIAGRYFCPEEGCNIWVIVTLGKTMGYAHNLHKHLKSHGKRLSDYSTAPVQPTWTQSLMLQATPPHYHIFTLPDTFSKDDLPQLAPPNPQPRTSGFRSVDQRDIQGGPEDACWMDTLGWSEYRKSIGAQDYYTLRSLVVVPSIHWIKLMKGSERWLESGLLQVHNMCIRYLSNAYQSIKYRHHEVRATITEG
jgi:hypothetical protein